MTELENKLVPTLKEHLSFWRRYVDDTLCFVKEGSCEFVLAFINNFHPNIKFTYETERNNMISFLDVLLVKRKSCIDTAVFRKSINSNLYINWNSFAPEVWKKSTLRCLVKREYKVCNQDYFLHMELEHLQNTFIQINDFPLAVVKRIFKEVQLEEKRKERPGEPPVDEIIQPPDEMKIVQLTLPYAGEKGELIAREINQHFKNVQPNIKARVCYRAKRLGSAFNIKDQTSKKYKHNVVYEVECSGCDTRYIGKSRRRLEERTVEHAGRDNNSHVVKHTQWHDHGEITLDNIKILNRNYKNYYKRKISEALFIKQKSLLLTYKIILSP